VVKPALVPVVILSLVAMILSGVLGFITAPLFGITQVIAYNHVMKGTAPGQAAK
jgi:hypothetical protein